MKILCCLESIQKNGNSIATAKSERRPDQSLVIILSIQWMEQVTRKIRTIHITWNIHKIRLKFSRSMIDRSRVSFSRDIWLYYFAIQIYIHMYIIRWHTSLCNIYKSSKNDITISTIFKSLFLITFKKRIKIFLSNAKERERKILKTSIVRYLKMVREQRRHYSRAIIKRGIYLFIHLYESVHVQTHTHAQALAQIPSTSVEVDWAWPRLEDLTVRDRRGRASIGDRPRCNKAVCEFNEFSSMGMCVCLSVRIAARRNLWYDMIYICVCVSPTCVSPCVCVRYIYIYS